MSRSSASAKERPRYRRGTPDREQNRLRRSLTEWKLALRIARRSVWRSRGTSLIVVIMVLLPVAGFSAVAVIGQSMFPTSSEKIAAELGQNEAKLFTWIGTHSGMVQDPYDPTYTHTPDFGPSDVVAGEPLDEAGVRALFPGAELTVLSTAGITAETEHGIGQLQVAIGPLWNSDFAGRTHVVDGEAPTKPGEVLVSAAALTRLGAVIGDGIAVTEPPATLTITGILNDAMSTAEDEWIYAPRGTFGDDLETWETTYYLPDTIITGDELDALNEAGVTVLSRDVLSHASSTDLAMSGGFWGTYGMLLILAAAFAVFEIVLLAGAAFAVGARKQQRALATLASVGGERRMLYRVVTSQGIVLGLLGGVVGLAIGIPAAALYMSLTADGSATQYWGFHAEPLVLGGITLVAALVGLAAAIAPARTAVKFDVLAALRGSRKPPRPSSKATAWGVGFLISGVGVSLASAFALRALAWAGDPTEGLAYGAAVLGLVLGPIVLQVGVIMCGGTVLRAISGVVSRFGLGARLAARDSAANRARSVPAFAAIMVTAFIAVLVINISVTTSRANAQYYWYQTAPGQVITWMPTDDTGAPSRSADEMISLIDSELDAASTAVVDTPLSRWDAKTGEQSAGTPVIAALPAENRCPTDPSSPEYDENLVETLSPSDYSMAMRELAENDWRCNVALSNFAGVNNEIIITDRAGLALYLGHEVPGAVLAVFEAGGAVVTNPLYILHDSVTLNWWEANSDYWDPESKDKPIETSSIDAIHAEPEVVTGDPVVISHGAAKQLGIETEPQFVVSAPIDEFSQAQIDGLNERLEPLASSANLETGPEQTWLYIIIATLLIAGVLFVGASAVAIGLSRADGRADDATLAAVGATRALRRRFAFWQAVVLVGIGTVTGTAAGLITTFGISLADTSGNIAFDPPWLAIGALVIGMPLAIAIGSWLVASKPTTLARRVAIG